MVLSVSNLIGSVLETKRAGKGAPVGEKGGGLSIDMCFLRTFSPLFTFTLPSRTEIYDHCSPLCFVGAWPASHSATVKIVFKVNTCLVCDFKMQ